MTTWSARPTGKSAGSKQVPREREDAAAKDTRTWDERNADDDGSEVAFWKGRCVCRTSIDYY